MKATAWVWTLGSDYPGVDQDDMNLPISRVIFKSHDGINWMKPPGELLALHNIYAAQNIDFGLWCVVWGTDPAGEAQMVVDALQAAQTDLMVLDVEPYAQFWQAPWSNLHPYMQAIRFAMPQARIGLSFDPRRFPYNHVDEIHFEEWLPYVDSLWPQVYWDTFGLADPDPLLEDVASYCLPTGKELVWVLPGHDPVHGRFQWALRTALVLGGNISIWRRGVTTQENWDIIAREGEQGGEPVTVEERLAAAEAAIANITNRLDFGDQVHNAHDAALRAILAQLEALAQQLHAALDGGGDV